MDMINNPNGEITMEAWEAAELASISADLDVIENSGLPTGGACVKGRPSAVVSVSTAVGQRFAVTVYKGHNLRPAMQAAGFVHDGHCHTWRANVNDFGAAIAIATAIGVKLYRC